LLWFRGVILLRLDKASHRGWGLAYVVVRFILIVMVLAQVIFLLIVLILEVVLLQFIVQLLELKSLASKPVDSTGDQLLLNIFAELVVKLKALLDVASGIVRILLGGRLGGVEEVEERLGLDGLLDNASLLGVCTLVSG
jgi:hypothetical protein